METQTRKLYELQAEIIKALGHPLRLAIVDLLSDGERCVCEIAGEVGGERSNVSRHLAVLQNAGILESRKDGLNVLYALRTPCVLNFLSCATDALRCRIESEQAVLDQL